MIKVSEIKAGILYELAEMYSNISYRFVSDPANASEKELRRARKWLEKQYRQELAELPAEIAQYLSEASDDREYFVFLHECTEEYRRCCDRIKEKSETICEEAEGETGAALKALLEQDYWPMVRRVGSDVQIICESGGAYSVVVTLKNAQGITDEGVMFFGGPLELTHSNGVYCISAELDGHLNQHSVWELGTITFTDASVRTEVFNCVSSTRVCTDPWASIAFIAQAIIEKAERLPENCNECELKLLPLLNEITYISGVDDPEEHCGFSCLTELADDELAKRLSRLSEMSGDRFTRYAVRLREKLCDSKYESMWRTVYDRICESQTDYPSAAEVFCATEKLQEIRARIEQAMHEQGFTGTYPDFVKVGKTTRISIESSYNNSEYIIGKNKNIVSFVRCIMPAHEDLYSVQFISGTAMTDKCEQPADILSCLFNTNGHTLFDTNDYFEPEGIEEDSAGVEQMAVIAAKRAQLLKLTKEERKISFNDISIAEVLSMTVLSGAGFALFMALAMLVLAAVIALIAGKPGVILDLITEYPWWRMMLFMFLGYGVTMGTVYAIAHRK